LARDIKKKLNAKDYSFGHLTSSLLFPTDCIKAVI